MRTDEEIIKKIQHLMFIGNKPETSYMERILIIIRIEQLHWVRNKFNDTTNKDRVVSGDVLFYTEAAKSKYEEDKALYDLVYKAQSKITHALEYHNEAEWEKYIEKHS